ncbi:MAG TPA: winged helix-turn-helix domain-containing protein [Nitrosopumilaceae archaeon]|jgi:predicted transcriptional regulator|nr:winged helix-turn-helix domain-containing protein [Nitrosopumilaceae archaeon]
MNDLIDYVETNVMGWGNRGWLEIIYFILVVCKKGSLKTHIMYKCNLNSKQIDQYIQFLLDKQLLERDSESSNSKRYTYKTSEVGRKYINVYNQLAEIFD